MVREFGGGRPLAITVRTTVDAPAGSGLGSSSALIVALVEAFRAMLDVPLGPYEIAHLAFEIERIELGLSGGKQDHYAAAFGGVNFIEFLPGGQVIVNPLRIARPALNELEISWSPAFPEYRGGPPTLSTATNGNSSNPQGSSIVCTK